MAARQNKDQPIAFITGVSGQDGSYLAELLLSKSYIVHGMIRKRVANDQMGLIIESLRAHWPSQFHLHYGDITDAGRMLDLVSTIRPSEIYNLAALSHVSLSFQMPSTALKVNAVDTVNLLQSVTLLQLEKTKYYQASSSEMFGNAEAEVQNEETRFDPVSPYAVAKLAAHLAVKSSREKGMYAVAGVLFNHESPRRGRSFVTRRITIKVAEISLGLADTLVIANLDTKRDWGHARDYVQAMWCMLQQARPTDFIIATGTSHSVREFIEAAFEVVRIKIRWVGNGAKEKGFAVTENNTLSRMPVVVVDPSVEAMRSSKVQNLRGDASKARRLLFWRPNTSFGELVAEMVQGDVEILRKAKGTVTKL
ncbi:GDP-mannose 4,6-dehydratase Gmd [Lophiotrema nucula]|uniref:GDP-mannose 4,6-dehydratase n=1 Tax=Lophiotrema nucula TaxID=690887 RepID=A0A6A5YUP2_9PLEO|nr:GDP-mannose 4,6-dehydratase Gmd [Lophiotrema nucula]